MSKIDELIKCGEKATQGEWVTHKHSSGTLKAGEHRSIANFQIYQDNINQEEVQNQNDNNRDFCKASANARPAIQAMRDENVRLREALKDCEGKLMTHNKLYLSSDNTIIRATLKKIKQALEGGSDE